MKAQKQIKIVIAGGGSAGWMAAAFLSKVLNIEASEGYQVTLLESPSVSSIGVGEATIHTLRNFLSACDIDEGEFIAKTGGTFKHGILFKDWLDVEKNHQYFHAFEGNMGLSPEPISNHWINCMNNGKTTTRYDRWSGVQSVLASNFRSPKLFDSLAYDAPVPYGYHINATKFAEFLRELSVERGVEHIVSHIKSLHQTEEGSIESLETENGELIIGDFFIDCTGFSRIISKHLTEDFVDYSDALFCDSAVTYQLPHDDPEYMPRPFTSATAREAGWTFEIDLQLRKGLGYVYSSKHLSKDAADEAFRQFFPSIPESAELNHLQMEVGRLNKSWNRNCLALGLAAGFLEPLESTGLYFIEIALRLLVDYWDPLSQSEAARSEFNSSFNRVFDDTMEFIVLHYILSNRDDSDFWSDVKNKTVIPDNLSRKLSLWQHKSPSESDFLNESIAFKAPNYSAVLYGMNKYPIETPISTRHISVEESSGYEEKIQKIQKMAVKISPSHLDMIRKLAGSFS